MMIPIAVTRKVSLHYLSKLSTESKSNPALSGGGSDDLRLSSQVDEEYDIEFEGGSSISTCVVTGPC